MKRTAMAFVLLLIPAVLYAEPPRPVITGAKTGQPGDLIRLDGSKSVNAKLFKWHIKPEKFDDGRESFEIDEHDPSSVRIASRPGVYSVLFIVSNDEAIAFLEWSVVISGGAVTPVTPITPVTPVTPTPPVVPAPQSLAEWVRLNATALVADQNRPRVAAALARQYRAWVVTGAGVPNAREFSLGQDALNQLILGIESAGATWAPFMKALGEKLLSMGMTTIPQYQAAWLEIASGLEALR